MKRAHALVLSMVPLLSGCAIDPTVPVQMYTGERANSDVATLYPLPAETRTSVLMRVDGSATGSCVTNCSFFRPVRVLPGARSLNIQLFSPHSNRAQLPLMSVEELTSARSMQPSIIGVAGVIGHAFVLQTELEFDHTFSAGRYYQLMLGYRNTTDHYPYIWWREIQPQAK